MRKIQNRWIESFPDDKQALMHKWLSEDRKIDQVDIFIIKHARRICKHTREII